MLTKRQKSILLHIIRDYNKNGAPVGSKSLARQLPQKVSSATVRNDMADLEHKGLLQKTHLSSGRLPSINGYRYYVHNMVSPVPVNKVDRYIIKRALNNHFQRIDEIVRQSANILSNLTNCTVMALRPETAQRRKLSGFRLVPLMNNEAMAILVTNYGEIRNQIFHLTDGITADQIGSVIKLINDQLVGNPISTVSKKLSSQFPKEITKFINTPEGFLDTFNSVLNKIYHNQLYVSGKLNLLNFSNHTDPKQIKAVCSLFNNTNSVSKLIKGSDEPVSVKMGADSKNRLLKHYSIITGKYNVGKYGQGVIAVLGPTRMPYSKIISIVDMFRKELAKRLLEYYHKYSN